MKFKPYSACILVLVLALFSRPAISTEIRIWPDKAPGETGQLGPERDTTKPSDNLIAGKRLIRLGNVTNPTLQVFRAKNGSNGAGVLVFPGGGYHILAMDLEGTEVCDWLSSLGITAVLLKYRVPQREGRERHAAPLQDAQRAFGLVRHRAKEFGLKPERIGVLGFSAGAHLAAALATSSFRERTYPSIDDSDRVSCRPDFSILIYPGYLAAKEDNRVPPEVAVTTNTPPTFLAMSQDDPVRVENVLFYGLALKQAKVPFELHVYPTGGHGYGLRKTDDLVTTWPDRVADWLRSRRVLE